MAPISFYFKPLLHNRSFSPDLTPNTNQTTQPPKMLTIPTAGNFANSGKNVNAFLHRFCTPKKWNAPITKISVIL
jgi:hypothetical protein